MAETKSSRRQFHKYKNNVLVESGTYEGEGVQDALNCGFQNVISFEVAPGLAEKCQARFKFHHNVKVVNDTSVNMYDYIKDIKEPITFWLDGHWMGHPTSYKDDHCPVLQELDVIARHPIKTHTIMIDDMRLFGTVEGIKPDPHTFVFHHVTIQQIINKAMSINPKYLVTFEDGHVPNDILVFHVKK